MSGKIYEAKNWQRLVQPERQQRMNPLQFFEVAAPGAQEIWADVGSGPGYYTLPLAERVKKVYATDISREMLEICRGRANEKKLTNIEFIESDSVHIDLKDQTVDRILMVNVFHEFSAVGEVLKELSRLLKPAGRIFDIDWRYAEMESGPPLHHRVREERVVRDFESSGFSFAGAYPVYEQNYLLEFVKPG